MDHSSFYYIVRQVMRAIIKRQHGQTFKLTQLMHGGSIDALGFKARLWGTHQRSLGPGSDPRQHHSRSSPRWRVACGVLAWCGVWRGALRAPNLSWA